MKTKLAITLQKSPIGASKSQRGTIAALGLHKRGQCVVREDTPAVRGMIAKLSHLLTVTAVEQD